MSDWQHATPSRSMALVRAIVDDSRFATLGAKAQAALLVAVIRYADHNGRWYVKAETLAVALGRSERRVRDAVSEWIDVGLVLASRRRRPDGTLSVYDFELDDVITQQADETVRLWTKTSAGASADKTVRSPSADETVRAERSFNDQSNAYVRTKASGGPGGGTAGAAAHRTWADNFGVHFAHDPAAFAEEAGRALKLDTADAERLRLEIIERTRP